MSRVAKQATTKARRFREQHGLGAVEPMADLLAVVETRCGVAVVILEALGGDIAGAYLPRDGEPVILLNGSDSPQRMRFTLAHELGHHVFHDDHREDTHAGLAKPGHWIEVRANAFAAALLMPEAAVAVPADAVTLDDVRAVADRFGVSLIAACFRFKSCGADVEAVEQRIREKQELMYADAVFEDSLSAARRALPRLPRPGSVLAAAVGGKLSPVEAGAQAGRAPAEVAGALSAAGLVPTAEE
jgi:Zn-dependent peptidase ImmA (M78 family)